MIGMAQPCADTVSLAEFDMSDFVEPMMDERWVTDWRA
jgi:hypothetical protein